LKRKAPFEPTGLERRLDLKMNDAVRPGRRRGC
jgi:hypothetical protein